MFGLWVKTCWEGLHLVSSLFTLPTFIPPEERAATWFP